MALISVPFDEIEVHETRMASDDAFKITLPNVLNEEVWERLLVIKELSYPHPIIVVFSERWIENDLEAVLTRLAVSAVSGVCMENPLHKSLVARINEACHLGLFILS